MSPPSAAATRWPESTYRLQLHKDFGFRQAAAIVPYLARLGITHVYASPYLMAAQGSTHGYDVIDHSRLNPELGARDDFDAWMRALREAPGGPLSHILDAVPNHAGVATNLNPWWNDVLEHGPAGKCGRYFDISWRGSPRESMHDRVLLPLLGKPYAQALEAGEFHLTFDAQQGRLTLHYYERAFPLDPRTYEVILQSAAEIHPGAATPFSDLLQHVQRIPPRAACDPVPAEKRRRLAAELYDRLAHLTAEDRTALETALRNLHGTPSDPRSWDPLDALLQNQPYRLAYWRIASDEINYRRFFDINDLAAIRMELPEVFNAVHELPFDLIRRGDLTGLRIDHPDGLFDPRQYLERLQERYHNDGGTGDLYVVVEKILAPDEPLRPDWPVAGASGYDFLNKINGLFVDPAGEAPLTRTYADWLGHQIDFHELAIDKKKLILDRALASELAMLTHRLDLLAQRFRASRDFTLRSLHAAVRETIACFDIYRTYITGTPIREEDAAAIRRALEKARRRAPDIEPALFDFLQRTLLLDYPEEATEEDRAAQREWVGRFQQLTSPVMAKGIEDTAFYLYHRLTSLNEVGGEPTKFGITPDELHRYLADRAQRWPYALSALSTHDTKRSEDVRARLHVLSELPDEWARAIAPLRPDIAAANVHPNDAYLLLQTLVGAWPTEPLVDTARESFTKRITAYMQKALREGKERSSWTDPDAAYEARVAALIQHLIAGRFAETLGPLQQKAARLGALTSLSQTLLRLCAPGVPDTYQGTEFFDDSLVDPDNRRPVDYHARLQMLNAAPLIAEAIATKNWNAAKQSLIATCLHLRRKHPGLFTAGTYLPAPPAGPLAHHLFAFAREHNGTRALVAVPRLFATLERTTRSTAPLPIADLWQSTALRLPAFAGRYINPLTHEHLESNDGLFPAKSLFTKLPLCILLST
ncbi:MAG TPA: malto-oligosyltrehalose synthase [Phycisphaerae bacterium]|nr:malto-oligosyltrehalose synthase [Phycisphaerae bacterium]